MQFIPERFTPHLESLHEMLEDDQDGEDYDEAKLSHCCGPSSNGIRKGSCDSLCVTCDHSAEVNTVNDASDIDHFLLDNSSPTDAVQQLVPRSTAAPVFYVDETQHPNAFQNESSNSLE